MICPLKFNSHTLDQWGQQCKKGCHCEKEGCAWWFKKDEKCAILDIADSIYGIERDGVGNA